MKALGIIGVALVLTSALATSSMAYWEEPSAAPPRSSQVVRSKPLDLTLPAPSPLEDFISAFKAQERRRFQALKDEYPGSDPWTGRYDRAAMREWQQNVLRQQGAAVTGALGDAAIAQCLQLPICQSPGVRAAASVASVILRGLHWHTPIGPMQARLDTPPGLKLELRRVRVSLEYRVVF